MTIALDIRNLTRRFGALTAVSNSSFVVNEHEVVSIIGPNGSGKTTTINLLSGELKPDNGAVLFGGADLAGATSDRVARAGMRRTFQNGRVFGNCTVEDNVLAGQAPLMRASVPLQRLRGVLLVRWVALVAETVVALIHPRRVKAEEASLRSRVDAELDRFGERLVPRRENVAATLSYANRRRTEIARALASSPRILLLDEPTAGMNTAETQEVMHQLLALKREGQTMLLVEHKLDLVMTVSDRVIVMDHGVIIAEGTPAEVQNDERVIEAYLGKRRGQDLSKTARADIRRTHTSKE